HTAAAHLIEAAHDRVDAHDPGADRVEMLVLGGELVILHVAFDGAGQQLEVVGDGLERIVDLMREADGDFARSGELLALAHPADVAREANRADLLALVIFDDRAGDHYRDELAALVAENGFEVGDTTGIARIAHRFHDAARLFDRRIDAEHLAADHFLAAVMETGSC